MSLKWREKRSVNLQVSRSLTIKQMAMVSAVAVFFIAVFTLVLLYHLVHQHRYDTSMQMESIARAVRQPLSAAILKGDIPQAEAIINHITPLFFCISLNCHVFHF